MKKKILNMVEMVIIAAIMMLSGNVRAGTTASSIDYEYLETNADRITSPIDGREYYKVDDMLFPEKERNFGGAYSSVNALWPNGKVYYQFQPDITEPQKSLFKAACQEWTYGTGLQFEEGKGEGNYIMLWAGTDNSSICGMKGGQNPISINTWSVGVIAHEIGHTLSLFHEHQRIDRDNYVTINYNNVSNSGLGEVSSTSNWPEYYHSLTNYDFLSIMHYNRSAFSMNGQDTITCNAGYEIFQDDIGQHCMISALDRMAISSLYGGTTRTCDININVNDSSLGYVRGGPVDVKDFDATHMKLANPGVPVTLRAVSTGSGEFACWEIVNATCADASTSTIVITPNSDCSVKANFRKAANTVSFYIASNQVSCGSLSGTTIQKVYDGGSTAPVTAIANSGYAFSHWVITQNGTQSTSTENPIVFNNITASITARAEFSLGESNSVTFTASEGGALQGDPAQKVVDGASTTPVTAIPSEGYVFSQWSITWNGGSMNSTDNPLTISNVTTDITAVVVFVSAKNKYTVSCEISPRLECGYVEGIGTFLEGSNVTITAKANKGYALAELKADGVSLGKVSCVAFDKISADHKVEAVFSETLNVNSVKMTASQTLANGKATANKATATILFGIPNNYAIDKNSSFEAVVGDWSAKLDLATAKSVRIKPGFSGTATFAKNGNATVSLAWKRGLMTMKMTMSGGVDNVADVSAQLPESGKAAIRTDIEVSLSNDDFVSSKTVTLNGNATVKTTAGKKKTTWMLGN